MLDFTEDELLKFTEKFRQVLQYVNKLSTLDTKDVKPTSHAIEGVRALLREDNTSLFENAAGLLKNAPALKNGLVEVPKVIEED